jgi:putative membrane protein
MNIERRNWTPWILLGLGLLLALGTFSTMGGMHAPFGYGGRPFVGGGPWLWGFGVIGVLARLAFWGVIIMLAVRFFVRRGPGRWDSGTYRSEHASLEILKQRYAAGEISREQFEEMRRVLDPTPATP